MSMDKIQIEGVATIAKGSFRFESGQPSDEPVVDAQLLKGRLAIKADGSAVFRRDGRCTNIPPDINTVVDSEDYKVKRTTRHYIVQIKLPIVESRAMTEERLQALLPEILGEITLDRKDMYGVMAA